MIIEQIGKSVAGTIVEQIIGRIAQNTVPIAIAGATTSNIGKFQRPVEITDVIGYKPLQPSTETFVKPDMPKIKPREVPVPQDIELPSTSELIPVTQAQIEEENPYAQFQGDEVRPIVDPVQQIGDIIRQAVEEAERRPNDDPDDDPQPIPMQREPRKSKPRIPIIINRPKKQKEEPINNEDEELKQIEEKKRRKVKIVGGGIDRHTILSRTLQQKRQGGVQLITIPMQQ